MIDEPPATPTALPQHSKETNAKASDLYSGMKRSTTLAIGTRCAKILRKINNFHSSKIFQQADYLHFTKISFFSNLLRVSYFRIYCERLIH